MMTTGIYDCKSGHVQNNQADNKKMSIALFGKGSIMDDISVYFIRESCEPGHQVR